MRDGDARRRSEHLDEVTPKLAEFVNRRIFGALRIRHRRRARRAREPALGGRLSQGRRCARRSRSSSSCCGDETALHETQRYYARHLADARLMTPSPVINRGVVWAKVNMLRVIKEYPQGWGSTNSPPSDILVSRDTSWFVHGYDYFLPQFSRDALELFNRFLEPSGQVVEYVRGVNGFKTSYDLNINDDTPLHIIAILHHYNATLDDAWLRGRLPAGAPDHRLPALAARRQRPGLLQGRRRRHVRHHLVAQHHPVLHARRRGDRDQRRSLLRARGRGDDGRGLRASATTGSATRGEATRAARGDPGQALQRRHLGLRPQLRSGRQLPGQLHRRRGLPGALRRRRRAGAQGDPAAAARARLRHAGRAAHDLDRRQLVFSLARLRLAGRRLARPHAVVRRRAGAQRRGPRRRCTCSKRSTRRWKPARRATPSRANSASGSTAGR